MGANRVTDAKSTLIAVSVLFMLGAFPFETALGQSRPALTASVDDPGRAPYQSTVRQFCFLNNPVCDFSFTAVPAGKRLVVQRATGYFSSRAVFASTFVFVSIRRAGDDTTFLPTTRQGVVPSSASGFFVFNEAVQEVYDAGEVPVVRIAHADGGYPILSGSSLPGFNNVTLAGYLIDCTAGPCAPRVP